MRCFLLLFSIYLSISGCGNSHDETFVSAWGASQLSRHWAGEDYWLNPLQSWKQEDGVLKCQVPGGDRNVVLLSRAIDDSASSFEMTVIIDPEIPERLMDEGASDEQNAIPSMPQGLHTHGWAGFQLGLQGQFNDYRDDAIKGIGLCAGLTTHGKLFIGHLGDAKEIIDTVTQRLQLRLKAMVQEDSTMYHITLSVENMEKKILGSHDATVNGAWLTGLMALTCSQSIPDTIDYSEGRLPYTELRPLNKTMGGTTIFSFSDWEISGEKISSHADRTYGPILWAQHTLSDGILKMSVQMVPLGNDNMEVTLTIDDEKSYTSTIDPAGRNALFRVENWDSDADHTYKITYQSMDGKIDVYEGFIRKDPFKTRVKVASLSCVDDRGFPHQDLVDNVISHNPDLYIFHGDQLYERVAGYGVERNSILDYLRKWYIFGWSFRDAMRNVPAIIIPDDHDVFHGNLWGEGGKRADVSKGYGYDAQDDGGYKEPPEFVNMVHATQTGHLPDPYDPAPAEQGISVYYTNMNYGGISFAILGDRQWKSAPQRLLREAEIENGWPQNKNWDAKISSDRLDAELLGIRQESFLQQWVENWSSGVVFKCVVSQSPFSNIATLPADIYHDKYVPGLPLYKKGEYPPDDRPVADFDSNGWPQNKRNKALKIMRKSAAIHLAGDQHLGSMGQYGIDDWGDGGFWVATPAVSNLWPRRWFPAQEARGGKRFGDSRRYTGNFEDGFGNKITVRGVANPRDIEREPAMVFDKAPGYAIIDFDRIERTIHVGVWPRWAAPSMPSPDNTPFEDWPITITQDDNLGKGYQYKLEPIEVDGNTLVKVYKSSDNELILSYKPKQGIFYAPVPSDEKYYILAINSSGDKKMYSGMKVNE